MTVAGLIFSNIHDQSIPEMTRVRTMASIPYGCRYRLIDFPLSNMVNSGITNVGVIAHYNYQSLLDHIGNGKDWDLARRSGGIKILPPYITAFEKGAAGKLYENRLEAILGATNFIDRCKADYIVMSDCDVILNIDLKKVVEEHVKTGAYMTLVSKKLGVNESYEDVANVLTADESGRVTGYARYKPENEEAIVATNILVVSREDLMNIVAEANARGYKSFYNDVIARQLSTKNIRLYDFDGWCAHISSLEGYFASSMELLKDEVRQDLFGDRNRQVYTKIRNSAPTKYTAQAQVTNSLVADGCVIEGTVENCILFRGVHVGKGTVIKNCILLQDTYVGSGVTLNCVVTDKDAVIKDGRMLSGHNTMPFFIGKGQTV